MRHGSSTSGLLPEQLISGSGKYFKLFPQLPPWRNAGILSLNDTIKKFAKEKHSDRATGRSSTLPAGYTYFGQFIDHDITLEPSRLSASFISTGSLTNLRTPALDLDSLYGLGPRLEPVLYDQEKKGDDGCCGYLLTGSPFPYDVPRNRQGIAIIGDPRNDENRLVALWHSTFIWFHNAILSKLTFGESANYDHFLEARRIVQWTFQYLVVEDFLRRICDVDVYQKILPPKGRPNLSLLSNPNLGSRIPIEFSAAAFRFGHSLVRSSYLLNHFTGDGPNEAIQVFSEEGLNLSGSRPLQPREMPLWDWLLDFESTHLRPHQRQKAGTFDVFLAPSLAVIPELAESLIEANLQRGIKFELPAGSDVASATGFPVLQGTTPNSLEDTLWVYILREASSIGGGLRLGPVG